MVSSWKLESSSTFHCSARGRDHRQAGAVPMLPPTCTGIRIRCEDVADQARWWWSCRWSRDADGAALQVTAGQFDLADHADAAAARGLERRRDPPARRARARSGRIRRATPAICGRKVDSQAPAASPGIAGNCSSGCESVARTLRALARRSSSTAARPDFAMPDDHAFTRSKLQLLITSTSTSSARTAPAPGRRSRSAR